MTAGSRSIVAVVLSASAAVLCALAARFGLVENEILLAACRAGTRADCAVLLAARDAVVSAFAGGQLGWGALILALLAGLSGWRPAAWGGWVLGVAGMILYNVEPASAAALLAVLLLTRGPSGKRQHDA